MPENNLDAATRVKALIALTEELSFIFEKENELLTARRPGELAPFQDDKSRLALAYAQSIREVAQDRRIVEGANDALMEKLKEITVVFHERAATQRALLGGAHKVAEGVLKAAAEEVSVNAKSPAYDKPGESSPKSAAAIAVNEEA